MAARASMTSWGAFTNGLGATFSQAVVRSEAGKAFVLVGFGSALVSGRRPGKPARGAAREGGRTGGRAGGRRGGRRGGRPAGRREGVRAGGAGAEGMKSRRAASRALPLTVHVFSRFCSLRSRSS